jgi:ABC-type transport system involved in multi-copper enzyme maturation permease subunit
MAGRWGLGPVFFYEWLLTSRRWQVYAGRAAFVLVLLTAMLLGWWAFASDHPYMRLQDLAALGENLFCALMGTQLVLVLLAAPAYAAGAVCVDKARGTLLHLLVTDLSSAEVVLGKLGSRMLPVLGLVLAALPVLAFTVLMGGVDPLALTGGTLVTLGVAVLACTLAVALSVWGSKAHEVLLANYLLWMAVLLAHPIISAIAWYLFGKSAPDWLLKTNPFWLTFAPYLRPGSVTLLDHLLFLAGCVVLSGGLAAVAVVVLRPLAVRHEARPQRRRPWFAGTALIPNLWSLLGPSLDFNPVLWREWHRRRPSAWVRFMWLAYAASCVFFSGLGFLVSFKGGPDREVVVFVNAFEALVGLLLLSVTASTSLSEERVRGSLDMLLATPLPTHSIVWGKWWGTIRTVPLLALLPMATVWLLWMTRGLAPSPWAGRLQPGAFLAPALILALLVAYGAAITSLGLAMATWIQRLGRAIAATVGLYALTTIAWPLVVMVLFARSDKIGPGLAEGSPFFGAAFTTLLTLEHGPEVEGVIVGAFFWTLFYAAVAGGLLVATLFTFDHALGRVSEGHARPAARRRAPRPVAGAREAV